MGEGKKLVFALAGNQNSGKTTLFNQLTGASRHVGNFPGVTVERHEGRIKGHEFAELVDLPGIYSMSPYSGEEIITRDMLIEERPDAIINIVDAMNIERNLYLTLQLIELSIPLVVALNMMDEMRANGNEVNIRALSERLGVPVIPISASKNEGLHELVDTAIDAADKRLKPAVTDFCAGPVHRCIHSIAHIVEDHAEKIGIPDRFAATKLVEGDAPIMGKLSLNENELETVKHLVREMENEIGTDREAALADMRYRFIERVIGETVNKRARSRERERSAAADLVLTHRVFALPIFMAIMFGVFWLTFGVVGIPLSDILGEAIGVFNEAVGGLLETAGINPVFRRFVTEGILTGVGTVVTFIPVIATLFLLLSLLEDSGYMARIAFVMDKPLRKIGLSGRSIVPMLLGFGCTVPAAMSARTLPSERDRVLSILLLPFMSCTAKLPIYALFTAVFFPNHGAAVMTLLYALGITIGTVVVLALKNVPFFRGNPVPFVMELPNYRLPNAKSVFILLWEKCEDFLTRAFTVIFAATVAIWILSNFDVRLYMVDDYEQSVLASLSRMLSPIFAPLGFGFWQATIAVITGIMAKEATISTLAVVSGTTAEELPAVMSAMFSTLQAFSFLIFVLLYTPCIAAMATIKRELGSGPKALLLAGFQFALAWLLACAIYQTGRLLMGMMR
ncbi:MAG: ferrous iron transport protein B [Synergistaceae bacterium]|jgi:ferrous iron transport protein B|nr:ferrous iron transport protein B [Synergistaceae bacterium]